MTFFQALSQDYSQNRVQAAKGQRGWRPALRHRTGHVSQGRRRGTESVMKSRGAGEQRSGLGHRGPASSRHAGSSADMPGHVKGSMESGEAGGAAPGDRGD